MNSKDLEIILKEGEGYNIEFKLKIDKSLSKELVAFSNSSGEEISFPRNPLLFDLFYRADFIEKVGSGITRIKNACKDRNIRIKFDTRDFFRVTFYKKTSTLKTTPKTTRKTTRKKNTLTNLENKILNTIKKNDQILRREIANELNISINTVKEYITKLKKKKVLERRGPPRGGRWVIK